MSSDSFRVSDDSFGESAPQTPPTGNRENINGAEMIRENMSSPPQVPLQDTGNSSDCLFHADLSRTENLLDILHGDSAHDDDEDTEQQQVFVARTATTFHSSNVNSPLLDFPVMTTQSLCPGSTPSDSRRWAIEQESANDHTNFIRNTNAESGTSVATVVTSSSSVTETIRWNNNMSLNRETIRYHSRRRRASSFDELPPVPRVSLRPRFTRHFDLSLVPASSRTNLSVASQHQPDVPDCACMECIMNSLSSESHENNRNPSSQERPLNNNMAGFLHIDHEVSTRPLPLRMHHPYPTRQRHFRNHTYGGSDASTDIFSLAMELEQSTTDQRGFSNDWIRNGSGQQPTATVPIIHPNPFELSSLNQNLPPAVQTFMAPGNPVNTTNTNSANITRPIPRYRKSLGLGETTFLNTIHSSIPRTRPSPIIATSNQQTINTSTTSNTTSANTTNTTTSTNNASPSLGTPTLTCTLSTSSVSAFDQTYSPQWQDHTSPGGSIFQGLKDHSSVHSSNSSSVKRGRDDDVECTETNNVNAKRSSHDDVGKHDSTLPFDEVHLLLDHTGEDNCSGKTASTEEGCHGKQP